MPPSDQDVCVVRDPVFLQHALEPSHPENPGRLAAVLELFDENAEWGALPQIQPRSAREFDLLRAHSHEMIQSVLAARGESGWFDPDTYFGEHSVSVALSAAGASIEAALKIWNGEFRRGFSLIRPPGHHATRERVMGFCLFNNVALAIKAIQNESPQARLAIVDFDLHHGNGTQAIFYDDPNVLFLSSHRYPYYPGTGALEEVGAGIGKGTTVNFPLGERYDDMFFLSLYARRIVPILREFNPEMILVSAGFDGHQKDPMRGFQISTSAFGKMTELLVSEAERNGGKILFCLEGGYNPAALKDSVAIALDSLVSLPRAVWEVEGIPTFPHPLLERFQKYYSAFFPSLR